MMTTEELIRELARDGERLMRQAAEYAGDPAPGAVPPAYWASAYADIKANQDVADLELNDLVSYLLQLPHAEAEGRMLIGLKMGDHLDAEMDASDDGNHEQAMYHKGIQLIWWSLWDTGCKHSYDRGVAYITGRES